MEIIYISVEEAKVKIQAGGLLIHTLPAEHFAKVHVPGAQNACVYQVTFLDDVRKLCADKNGVLIVYGSSGRSKDAAVAAEKLQREGYRQVFVLDGGIVAWQAAGFPVEGEAGDKVIDSAVYLPSIDGEYHLDTETSMVEWSGRNQNGKHFGTLPLQGGHLLVQGKSFTGELVVNMDGLKNTNLQGDELYPVLISHLKSDDFFFTKLFPTATLIIDKGELADTPYATCTNSVITGRLTLRGVTKALDFPATITSRENGGLSLEAHFDLDRTRWNIIYGSTRYFEHLGRHKVFDQISIELRLILNRKH